LDIKVVEKEEMKVVGISWSGNFAQRTIIPQLFEEMEKRLNDIAYKTDEPVLIAPFHSRETDLTYYVMAPVEKLDDIPEGMSGFTIPKKYYVHTTHVGRFEEIKNTYHHMYAWMKEYGYDQDYQALSLEVYKHEHILQNKTGDLHFDIYLPVKIYK
jgi:AraC family transcriptional regulator